jgi:deazaflavin-dependent oxidoreductase (nitroreductase family)
MAVTGLGGVAARLRLGPNGTRLLSVRARRSGAARTTPVSTVDEGGERWLVAPYGTVAWVHNARAAGPVSLRRGGRRGCFAVEAVDAESAPVLRASPKRPAAGPASRWMTGSALGRDDSRMATTLRLIAREMA